MASHAEPEYFKKARQNGWIVVSGISYFCHYRFYWMLLTLWLDPPKFDLDAYISNYRGDSRFSNTLCILAHIFSGRTQFNRLLLIGSSSSYLYSEALKLAIKEAKAGNDVGRYERATTMLKEIAPEDEDGNPDIAWIDRTSKKVTIDTDRLEQELKGYKNNLIKESIRVWNPTLHEL